MIKEQADKFAYTSGRISKKGLYQRLKTKLICISIYLVVRVLFATFRHRIKGYEHIHKLSGVQAKKKGYILACWHENIIATLYALVHMDKKVSILVSSSKDGEIIAWCAHKLGIRSFRGSSSQGGKKALMQLLRYSAEGSSLAISVDGPRGPRRHPKHGVFLISKKNQVPIIAFSVKAKSYWRLSTWDKMCVPKPFTLITSKYCEPIFIDSSSNKDEMRQEVVRLSQMLSE